MEPSATPLETSMGRELESPKRTWKVLFDKKEVIHARSEPGIPETAKDDARRSCGTFSNAFDKSKETHWVAFLWSEA
jgi:hypothetical protein